MTPGFVKSNDTRTPVANSRAEVEKILRRYGAVGFQVSQDYSAATVTITFVIPDSPQAGAPNVPVKLPVHVHRVYDALYGRPTRTERIPNATSAPYSRSVHDLKGYNAKKMEQAERVAWRHLVLWVDAALSAAGAGMQTITEAFFAHAVVGADGSRMIDLVEQQQSSLGAGVQRLLTAHSEEL